VEVLDYEDDSLGGVEADARAEFRFGDVEVGLTLSRLRTLGTTCVVTGTKAEVRIGTDFPAGVCTLVSASGEVLHQGDPPVLPPARDEWDDLFVEQLANFAAACTGTGVAPFSDAEDGRRVAELIERCYLGAARRAASQPWLTHKTAGSVA
jgi:predicted dehydrogenase